MIIIVYNLTQHMCTAEQKADGIVDVEDKKYIQELETFTKMPTKEEIRKRAVLLSEYAVKIGAKKVMIGGAFYLMTVLVEELKKRDIAPYFAFTTRKSIDITTSDGSVQKRSIFVYLGLIEA